MNVTNRSAFKVQHRVLILAVIMLLLGIAFSEAAVVPEGRQFIGLNRLNRFTRSAGNARGETVLLSPEIVTRIQFNELIASWNAQMPEGSYLKVEARGVYPHHYTRWYSLGLWSPNPAKHPRESVAEQRDEDGKVLTDTLVLTTRTDRFQVRVTFGGYWYQPPKLSFLGFSVCDTTVPTATEDAPNRLVWGQTLPVPERSQMAHTNGDVLCSPATVSMMLGYWAEKTGQKSLDKDIPVITEAVYDATWKGTGNWSFNMAYAGSLPGMKGYVARLSGLPQLEAWVAKGVPVGLSVCYNLLRGKEGKPSGHLVVVVGFTESGDVVINDPGTAENVRKVFPRANVEKAWAYSGNTVYLLYPISTEVPMDKHGHWDSWTARQRVKMEDPSLMEIK